MEKKKEQRGHVVVIPLPLQGHIRPAMDVAKRIVANDNGITVTLVNTDSCHRRLLQSNGREDPIGTGGVVSAVVSDGLPLDFDRSLHHDEFILSLQTVMAQHVEQLLLSLATPATHLLVDTYYSWSDALCNKLQISHLSFWTETAAVFSIYYHWHLLILHGHLPFPRDRTVDERVIDYVPGLPPLSVRDLPSYLQASDVDTNSITRFIRKCFDGIRGADAVVATSVETLEGPTVAALATHTGIPFLSLGPTLEDKDPGPHLSLWEDSQAQCDAWLDRQPRGSVIYVSFGSYAHVAEDQLAELAAGLRMSGHRFLWAARDDLVLSSTSKGTAAVPVGAVGQEEGLVVTWCRQRQVLRHVAVGGFLTHCGWNSIVESLYEGVPMLAMPLLTDQFTNARLAVHEWGVALDAYANAAHNGIITAPRVCQAVRLLMATRGTVAEQLRGNVARAREALKTAHTTSRSNMIRLCQIVG